MKLPLGWRIRFPFISFAAALLLAGCAPTPTPRPTPTAAPATLPALSATAPPSITITSVPSLTPTLLPVASPTTAFQVCAPLAGMAIADLPAAVSNPYRPPKPGRDDPHAGIDLAERDSNTQVALAGHEVDAALAGRVAAVIQDRFPFGNAVIVESPFSTLPADYTAALNAPQVTTTLYPPGPLTCPPLSIPAGWDFSSPSLYLLYAHMAAPAAVSPGDAVACGQPLGAVGQTGNALNPHLHLEVRVGPGGATFDGLAHYLDSATPTEMANYCAWTVTGLFQLVDPLKLFQ
jgi:murein DD-endopeptidase MepM/ murein hydrolase activator NlpD